MTEVSPDWPEQVERGLRMFRDVGGPSMLGKFFERVRRGRAPGRDWEAEALAALRQNSLDTLRNVDLTISEAVRILGSQFHWDDLKELDRTWSNHYLAAASKVASDDDERRAWWARLLAGEIETPGSFSLRTLAAIDVLSAEEARLFTRLSPYVWKFDSDMPALVAPRTGSSLWVPNTVEWGSLEAAGLVTHSPAGLFIDLDGGDVYRITFGGTVVVLRASGAARLPIGEYLLTESGRQIWSLTDRDVPDGYLEEILGEWRKLCDVVIIL